jgi:hypothetical protein
MTEAEWFACTDPTIMLEHLKSSAAERSLRLFGCGVCRMNWHLVSGEQIKSVIEVVERFVERSATKQELEAARTTAEDSKINFLANEAWAAAWVAWVAQSAAGESVKAVEWVRATRRRNEWKGSHWDEDPLGQSRLLRDIFGNPFRPLPPRPEAITPLADEIYAGCWDKMPLLGEWLQERGYWSEGEHCLDPHIHHVKGCWVVDWVLGKE